jgi:hypothetical protein
LELERINTLEYWNWQRSGQSAMHYHLNTTKQRIEITAPNGFVVAFINYCDFGSGYGYFSQLLGDIDF